MAVVGVNPDGTERKRTDQLARAVYASGLRAREKHSTDGSRQESWVTPRTSGTSTRPNKTTPRQGLCLIEQVRDHEKAWATPRAEHDSGGHRGTADTLHSQIKAWGTPTARDFKSGRGKEDRNYKELTPMVERTQAGKLNPRWVETLMGLPVGWVMPSCASPVIIAPTNCDCSETELSQPPPSKHSELF
jgi:hypothetical protein